MCWFKRQESKVHNVVLQSSDGTVKQVEATFKDGNWTTSYFGGEANTLLLPNGVVQGPCYVKRWFGSLPDGLEGTKS